MNSPKPEDHPRYDRDRLAKGIQTVAAACGYPAVHSRAAGDIADGVIAAGWRPPPRVITDPAVADQLPAGTVVITDGGQVAQRYDGMGGWWQILDGDQWESADLIGDGHIVVLHEPEEAR